LVLKRKKREVCGQMCRPEKSSSIIWEAEEVAKGE
jgi:hypothetical protein